MSADIIPFGRKPPVYPPDSMERVWQDTPENKERDEKAAESLSQLAYALASAADWPTEEQRIEDAQIMLGMAHALLNARLHGPDGGGAVA